MRDRGHRQGVIANNPVRAAQHVRGGRAGRGRSPRRVAQPTIERRHATIELIEAVMIAELLDRPQRLGTQRAGIRLRLRA